MSNLEPAGSDPAVVDIWLGLGQTEVIVPQNVPVRIDGNVLIGSIDYQGLADGQDRGGLFLHDSRAINPGNPGDPVDPVDPDDEKVPLIRVWTLIGQVRITDEPR